MRANFLSTMSRSRGFAITDFEMNIERYEKVKHDLAYAIAGDEICPDTKKPHWQVYIHFKNQRSFDSVRKKFAPLHISCAVADAGANRRYCSKDGNVVFEWGRAPVQGERVDLEKLRDRICDGARVDDIVIEQPMSYHQYGRTMNKIEDIVLRKKFRTEMTKGTWYWGKTGTGKSHKAFENYSPETHYVWRLDDKGWQDDYCGQETVIINDLRYEVQFNQILQLVDKFPHHVIRRGRAPMPFTSKHVIITSPLHPRLLFTLCSEDNINQLYRRFEIIELTERNDSDDSEVPGKVILASPVKKLEPKDEIAWWDLIEEALGDFDLTA